MCGSHQEALNGRALRQGCIAEIRYDYIKNSALECGVFGVVRSRARMLGLGLVLDSGVRRQRHESGTTDCKAESAYQDLVLPNKTTDGVSRFLKIGRQISIELSLD
jgi:hypothetical protein